LQHGCTCRRVLFLRCWPLSTAWRMTKLFYKFYDDFWGMLRITWKSMVIQREPLLVQNKAKSHTKQLGRATLTQKSDF
jgi:hypothetical protein